MLVTNKINSNYNANYKEYEKYPNKALYIIQKLYLSLFSSKVLLTNFVSSIFSVHSSTNLSNNFLIHLQFE